MAKEQLPPIKVECRYCYGDGWVRPGNIGSDTRYKQTCAPCEGKGWRMISPFEFDPQKDTKL